MELITAINSRRSIRRYTPQQISREEVRAILEAGIKAPSAKNLQPWRFVVVQGMAKEGMLQAMRSGVAEAAEQLRASGRAGHLASAEGSIRAMEQAPVTVLVLNPHGDADRLPRSWEEQLGGLPDMQSIGACIQNMLLAATALGIGSLWMCDVYFAYRALQQWLGSGELIAAAVALGIADEEPTARPRTPLDSIVEWR